MRPGHVAGITAVALLGGACQRTLEHAPCPCLDPVAEECCTAVTGEATCYPRLECPIASTWHFPAWDPRSSLKRTTRECGDLIDDVEDDDGIICEGEGRVGAWYVAKNGVGEKWPGNQPIQASPIPPSMSAGNGSVFAIQTFYRYDPETTPPDSAISVLLGVDLQHDGSEYGHYDASRYDGIRFLARSSNAPTVEVNVVTVETAASEFGGTHEAECSPSHVTVQVTDGWERYDVPFASLTNELCTCPPCSFAKNGLINIQFQYVRERGPQEVELWVDDLEFYSNSAGGLL